MKEEQELKYSLDDNAVSTINLKNSKETDLNFAMVEGEINPINMWNYWATEKLKNIMEKLDLKYQFIERINLKTALDFHEIEKRLRKSYEDIEVLRMSNNPYSPFGNYFSIKYQKFFSIYKGVDALSPWVKINTMSNDEDFNFCFTLKKQMGINNNVVSITWNYTTTQGQFRSFEYRDFINEKFYDEAYPYIEKGLGKYINSFFKSESNILILQGPPGTGKTKFLRKLMLSSGKSIFFTADESLLASDQFFVNYLDTNSILILEDMDSLFKKRINGNTILNKFLTISDGIMQVNKKIIFTTNIPIKKQSIGIVPSGKANRENIGLDEALTRPGRCFDVLSFRKLTYQESMIFLEKVTKKKIRLNENNLYTLAELYELINN